MSMQVRVMTDATASCATKACSGENSVFSETPTATEKLAPALLACLALQTK